MDFHIEPAAMAIITTAIVIGPALFGGLRRIALRLYEGRTKITSRLGRRPKGYRRTLRPAFAKKMPGSVRRGCGHVTEIDGYN